MGNLPLVEDEGKMVCSLRGLLDTHSIVCTRRHNFAVHPATWPLAELRLYQVRNACCYRVCVGRWWRLHPNKNSQSHCGDPPLVIKTPERNRPIRWPRALHGMIRDLDHWRPSGCSIIRHDGVIRGPDAANTSPIAKSGPRDSSGPP
jgi:hypothetical protein